MRSGSLMDSISYELPGIILRPHFSISCSFKNSNRRVDDLMTILFFFSEGSSVKKYITNFMRGAVKKSFSILESLKSLIQSSNTICVKKQKISWGNQQSHIPPKSRTFWRLVYTWVVMWQKRLLFILLLASPASNMVHNAKSEIGVMFRNYFHSVSVFNLMDINFLQSTSIYLVKLDPES